MASLEKRIRRLRIKNCHSRHFIPDESLYSLLTKESIADVVSTCQLQDYDRSEIVDTIYKGGRKIFAILLLIQGPELIAAFVERDQALPSLQLDSKLPLTEPALESIIPQVFKEFYETQWEVLAPFFSKQKTHRSLDLDTILPFTSCKAVGKGGFGKVFEMSIPASHQGIYPNPGEEAITIIQKELMETDSVDADFENEKHVLSYLRCLEHPNILELLGSFTYRNTHVLLFPPASEDLGRFMSRSTTPKAFRSDLVIFSALLGLTSAIEKVHTYTSSKLNINMIGCHYDLKPKNILVSGQSFVLADFGISRLKKVTDDSKTTFKLGHGHYLAPECPNVADGFKRHSIGRASDIWSFGCVLVELMIFVTFGTESLEEFREQRETTDPVLSFTTRVFYQGKSLHNRVDAWLTKLSDEGNINRKILIRLIRDTLEGNPDFRPNAKEIKSRLRFLVLKARFQCVEALYLNLLSEVSHQEASIESARFQIWGKVLGLGDVDGHWDDKTGINDEYQFADAVSTFTAIEEELSYIISKEAYPFCSPLPILNDRLQASLSTTLQKQMRTALEHRILITEDLNDLEESENMFKGSSAHPSLSLLLAIKRMTIISQSEAEESPELCINIDSVELGERLESHRLGFIRSSDATQEPVLVEWMEYDAYWAEETIGKKLHAWIGMVARLHRSVALFSAFRALHCLGYYHDAGRHAFGLVYEYPPPTLPVTVQGESQPRTLKTVIDITCQDRRQYPLLGDRFVLATHLTASLLGLHKVGWLHKNISPSNVVFFGSPTGNVTTHSPYIIGFNHSRPIDKVAFSQGPRVGSSDWMLRQEYQHPDYRRRGIGFRAEYDCFSIGMLLLEIGLWRPITPRMAKDTTRSPEQKQQHVFDELVPLLGSYMGARYRDAVRYCLQVGNDCHRTSDEHPTEAAMAAHIAFEKNVVDELAKCSA